MPIFDSATLSRFYNQGENIISDERPFLVDRLALTIVAGTSTYTLPDYVRSIRRITYFGNYLDPLPRRAQRDIFQAATQMSKPFWYIFNNIGLNKIQLFPVPNQNVAPVTNLWGNGISATTGCIVEFYRVTDNSSFVLPPWIKRQLLKQYVAQQTFQVDGQGNNLKLAQYFSKRWQLRKQEFIDLLDELIYKPRKLCLTSISGSGWFPGRPILPIDRFGTSVDTGE